MAKPPHYRLTWSGNVGGSQAPLEFWSFSLGAPLPFDAVDADLDAVATALRGAYVGQLLPETYSDQHMTRVEIARIREDGRYYVRPDGSYQRGEWVGVAAGNTSPVGLPLQTALAVSLVTERAGASGRGRFFLPAPARPIEAATKCYSVASATALAAAAAGFVNAVNTALGTLQGSPKVSVVSSKGFSSVVTGVRVGRAPDTMRSRRRDVDEGHVFDSLA